ncbi:MAG TPA: TetR/AcrR family transcriptional regulator [Rhizomicrobium sp.]|jgi:AcrR family transcriptional regulator|nr:TetR/AcrR family transcriptional regulator [Rhizomicrobium sp.]
MEAAEARWTRRKQARPAEILDAALTVFAAKGYAAARMDDIAREAGVTKGTIYLYFADKEALFKALVSETIGPALGTVAAQVQTAQGSARDLIRFALTTLANLLMTNNRVALPKIIIAESGNFPELARFYRFEVVAKGLAAFSTIVERGIAQGEFRPLPVEHIVRLCIAPALFAAIWQVTFAQFDDAPTDYKSLIDTHLDVLFRGLAPQGAQP